MRRIAAVLGGVVLAGATGLGTPAIADGTSPTLAVQPSWGTGAPTSTPFDAECTVCTEVRVGSTLYIGGSFTQLTPPKRSAATAMTVGNLAAIDVTTGKPVATWQAQTNGRVLGLALSPDGSRIYAAGAFTTVNGHRHARLVALDPATGSDDPSWRPSADKTVRAITATATTVYVGGDFDTVDGTPRSRLAAVTATTGGLDATWVPSVGPPGRDVKGHIAAHVRALSLSTDGTGVYAGGYFQTVGGVTQSGAALLRIADGSVDPSFRPTYGYQPSDAYHSDTIMDFAFATASGRPVVYAAMGGWGNALDQLDPGTGARAWRVWSGGDVQTVTTDSTGEVFAGGHFRTLSDVTGQQFSRTHLAALDSSGHVDPSWAPPLGPTTGGGFYGCWVLRSVGGDLYAGGDFSSVGRLQQPHLAIFR